MVTAMPKSIDCEYDVRWWGVWVRARREWDYNGGRKRRLQPPLLCSRPPPAHHVPFIRGEENVISGIELLLTLQCCLSSVFISMLSVAVYAAVDSLQCVPPSPHLCIYVYICIYTYTRRIHNVYTTPTHPSDLNFLPIVKCAAAIDVDRRPISHDYVSSSLSSGQACN